MEFEMMQLKNNLRELVTNPVLLAAAFAWLIAQIIKIFTSPSHRENISFLRFVLGSGGMPSSHSAAVCATCFSCGILYGYDSAIFAVSAVLAVVVMRDAAGIRREAGKQAQVINQVSQELSKKRKTIMPTNLQELLGHTPLQVVFGGLLGLAMAYFCQCWLFLRLLPV